jgi:macrodomain Ter protein organizer (MatP/YcbG family)
MARREGAERDWTKPRSVRVPDDVWEAAKVEAERRGETVTDAVVRFLRRYGKG